MCRRLDGKLNYLTITRLHISYAVSALSKFFEAPTVLHWEVVTHIIWYLKRAPGLGYCIDRTYVSGLKVLLM